MNSIMPYLIIAIIVFISFSSIQTTFAKSVSTFQVPQERTVRPVWGLGTHEREGIMELPVIRRVGVSLVRNHYVWPEVEKEKGVFEFAAHMDRYVDVMTQNGLDFVHVLCYGNDLYGANNLPQSYHWYLNQSDDFYAGFEEYSYQMANRYGLNGTNQIKYWEIWNEPNPMFDIDIAAEQYMRIVQAAYTGVRRADPNAYIMLGGISRVHYEFLEACLKRGAADYIEGIAFHPYRESTFPEDAFKPMNYGATVELKSYAEEIEYLRDMISQYTDKDLELWITEIGFPTHDSFDNVPKDIRVSEIQQAKYLGRVFLQNLGLGLERVIWYRFHDSRFYGLTDKGSFSPRRGLTVLERLCEVFEQGDEYTVLSIELGIDGPGDWHQYVFQTTNGEYIIALWEAGVATESLRGSTHEVKIEGLRLTTSAKATSYDLLTGAKKNVKFTKTGEDKYTFNVELYDSPVIMHLR